MLSLHSLRTLRHRRLLLAAAGGLATVVTQTGCPELQDESATSASTGGNVSCTTTTPPFTEQSTDMVIDLDGGAPEAAAPMACGASTERFPHTSGLDDAGQPLDITQLRGYTPDPTTPMKAAMLLNGDITVEADQMRGTPFSFTQGGSLQFSDIYRTLDSPAMSPTIRGTLFRDGPRGVNLESPVFVGKFGSPALQYGPGFATVFPVTMARGATWDLDLEQRIGSDLADEVLATGNTLTISPCVNLLRHPAWGRAQETYGEDTFAVGRMGTAYTEGVQKYIPACVKHFAAYDVEDGRSNQIAVLDSQTLHEVFGRLFEMIVQDAGVACVMASYNSIQVTDLDNVAHKDTQNSILLNDILRNTFGFKGFVMSDFWAMPGFQNTGSLPSVYQAQAKEALAAGLDMEMPWQLNYANLEAVATPQQLQTAAMRIVEQKVRFNVANLDGKPMGLTPPVTSLGPNGLECNGGHIADAELQAEEAMVLLKNQNNTLPIDKTKVQHVVVVGASVPWTLSGTGQNGIFDFATDPRIGDEGSSRVRLDPSTSVGPAAGIAAAAGVPLIDQSMDAGVPPIDQSMDGGADAGGGITVTSRTCSTPAQCADPKLTADADFVVVVAGLTPQDEGEEYTGAGDRSDSSGTPHLGLDAKFGPGNHPDLVGLQDGLITSVAAQHKPMAVVIEAGAGVNMPWIDSVPALVMAWYPGQQGGTALGRLLFGDVNFSGKLPITWPVNESQEPAFNQGGTNGGSTNMGYYFGYRYFDFKKETPLFALGSGLSYTTFKYDFMNLPCSTVDKHGVVDVQVAVTNTGSVPGNEVTFLFASYPDTTARRSVKELKGFHRTSTIQPGETVEFTIPLRVQDLKYWNSSATPPAWTVESGRVNIMVGGSSDDLPLTGTLTVQ